MGTERAALLQELRARVADGSCGQGPGMSCASSDHLSEIPSTWCIWCLVRAALSDDVSTFADGYSAGGEQMRRDMQQAQAWQPIETAPRDGTHVLAVVRGDYKPGVSFVPTVVEWSDRLGGWVEDSDYVCDECGLPSEHFKPTHWMPLPAPPQGPPAQEMKK